MGSTGEGAASSRMPVLFTDITSISVLILMVLVFDVIGFEMKKFQFSMLIGGVLAMFGVTSVAQNGYVITSSVYNPNTSAFINQQSDPTFYLLILGLLALASFAMYTKEML